MVMSRTNCILLLSCVLVLWTILKIPDHHATKLGNRDPSLILHNERMLSEIFTTVQSRHLSSSPSDSHATEDDHHTTDDHSSSSGGHAISLFGSISSITPTIGTISIIIIIVAILCIQSVFHTLHAFTHETSFRHMVTQIENELMIVGCSAFIFKVILNTTSFLDPHWAHALEFAGENCVTQSSIIITI